MTAENFDPLTHEEMEAIAMMVRESSKYGLQIECIRSFAQDVARGVSIPVAAAGALYEWDI